MINMNSSMTGGEPAPGSAVAETPELGVDRRWDRWRHGAGCDRAGAGRLPKLARCLWN